MEGERVQEAAGARQTKPGPLSQSTPLLRGHSALSWHWGRARGRSHPTACDPLHQDQGLLGHCPGFVTCLAWGTSSQQTVPHLLLGTRPSSLSRDSTGKEGASVAGGTFPQSKLGQGRTTQVPTKPYLQCLVWLGISRHNLDTVTRTEPVRNHSWRDRGGKQRLGPGGLGTVFCLTAGCSKEVHLCIHAAQSQCPKNGAWLSSGVPRQASWLVCMPRGLRRAPTMPPAPGPALSPGCPYPRKPPTAPRPPAGAGATSAVGDHQLLTAVASYSCPFLKSYKPHAPVRR